MRSPTSTTKQPMPMAPAESAFALQLGSAMRTPRLRTLSEFAEQEIIVPDGPFDGRRLRLDRHPVGRLLLDELGSGRWQRAFITGPNQDGKSLMGFVIPTLYLLFERRETVVMGVPTEKMVDDKWSKDLRPVIRASRYRDLLPESGAGSRGGTPTAVEFRNGVTLRFMTGGGDDQSRSSYTTPNLVVTETDGFDEVGSSSREGSKFAQLERRTLAFVDRARVIAECTVSTESGRTWQEYQNGSRGRIALKCPHCSSWVTPEREHFSGWQDAASDVEACEKAALACPECGELWTNEQRLAANRNAVLAHRGQEVAPDGTVTGPLPPTNTLGFRWTVVNSILNPNRLASVGGIEWRARRATDEDAAERDVRQSQWALPAKPAKEDLSKLDAFAIMTRRMNGAWRGTVPELAQFITVAADVGKRLCHWAAIAWLPNATPHILDYGRLEVPCEMMAEEEAILLALRAWRDSLATGWKRNGADIVPVLKFVDSGDWQSTILAFVAESGPGWFATKGFGSTQRRSGAYKRDTGSKVVGVGDHYNLIELPTRQQQLEINVDHWKSWIHARLQTPIGRPGALTLFDSNDHLGFAKHLTAEKRVEEFVPGEGTVTKWIQVSRNNHWLDATVYAAVAGHAAGARLIGEQTAEPKSEPKPESDSSNPLTNYRGRW